MNPAPPVAASTGAMGLEQAAARLALHPRAAPIPRSVAAALLGLPAPAATTVLGRLHRAGWIEPAGQAWSPPRPMGDKRLRLSAQEARVAVAAMAARYTRTATVCDAALDPTRPRPPALTAPFQAVFTRPDALTWMHQHFAVLAELVGLLLRHRAGQGAVWRLAAACTAYLHLMGPPVAQEWVYVAAQGARAARRASEEQARLHLLGLLASGYLAGGHHDQAKQVALRLHTQARRSKASWAAAYSQVLLARAHAAAGAGWAGVHSARHAAAEFHRAGDGRGLGQAQAAWGQALLTQQRPGEAVLLLGQAVIGLDAAGAEVSAAQARLELARAHAAQGPPGALRAEHLLLKVRTDAGRLGAQALRRRANTLLAACRRHRTDPAAPRRPPIRR